MALTDRAERRSRDGFLTVLRRRLRPEPLALRRAGAAGQIAAAPILAVAVDPSQSDDALAESLRNQVQKMLASRPGARLACINVLKSNLVTIDTTLDEHGRNRHVQRLLELRHWAAPLHLAEGRVTFHVLEAADAAAAILDYARANRVDHMVLGARENSLSRRLLGSVAGQVAAEAPCSVTVVRRRRIG